ncbi:hypothetical protein [Ruegeria lacuscaerulensis]|uniref:hypothetical protein n=1 Tax=Ruegeria lacuscaerulensis TaxID=55218 RepID=UPI00158091B7|nr:hypothetical protein [Ruegeria lacuscaerulensis]
MAVEGISPAVSFPEIGTVKSPAVFYDGRTVFLSYEIAPVSGGGVAILKFDDVIEFRIDPMNVEGLRAAEFPVKPWDFQEVTGSEKTERWKALKPRFWTISFNDETIEVVFKQVELIDRTHEATAPDAALMELLASNQADRFQP